MQAYKGRCAITGCNLLEALEAVHIIPYSGTGSDHVCNGLLLRLDLHSLFDAFRFSFEPEGLRVQLSATLRGGYYKIIDGAKLRQPEQVESQPNREALSQHYNEFVSREKG